ncbi:hypothetical protein BYT27DRAFT_7196531 [Phlegmacium glaucopus]|nr:hypothetical protein BYT27DRAFT_7196531 [Phlegmacium glaucopus]
MASIPPPDFVPTSLPTALPTASSTVISTSSPSVSASASSSNHLTTAEIVEIVIGSVAFVLLIVLVLIYVFVIRRSRKKYRHPEDRSKIADTVESAAGGSMLKSFQSKSLQDDWRSISEQEHGGTTPIFAAQTQRNINPPLLSPDSHYFKDPYTPSTFVNETHDVPLDSAQSQGDTEPYRQYEAATLLPARPISSNPPRKVAPLNIPGKPLNHSNGKRSTKRRQKTLDSGLETDDSASLYSAASASSSTSNSSMATIIPVPPIPRLSTPSVDGTVNARRREESIRNSYPTTPSLLAPLPPVIFNRDEAEEDDTEIYNVAKLLHSRQSRLPTNPNTPSRNSSIVSHIERSGSIRPVLLPAGESESESYRPRYDRWKQNRNALSLYAPNTSAPHPRDSMSPSSHVVRSRPF